MKTQKGNVAVIALIIVVVAITASVITWLVATKTQVPVVQPVAQTQPAVKPVAPATQPVTQPIVPDKFAGWQTYTNVKYGFTFKYPGVSEFTKVDEDPSSNNINNNDGYFGAALLKFNLPTKDPQWIAQGLTTFPALTLVVMTKAGLDAFNKACKGPDNGPLILPCDGTYSVVAQNDKYVYYLHNFNQDAPADAITGEQLDQILSTFRLVE